MGCDTAGAEQPASTPICTGIYSCTFPGVEGGHRPLVVARRPTGAALGSDGTCWGTGEDKAPRGDGPRGSSCRRAAPGKVRKESGSRAAQKQSAWG